MNARQCLAQAEHDLKEVMKRRAQLSRIPIDGETTAYDWIGTALVNVQVALKQLRAVTETLD